MSQNRMGRKTKFFECFSRTTFVLFGRVNDNSFVFGHRTMGKYKNDRVVEYRNSGGEHCVKL